MGIVNSCFSFKKRLGVLDSPVHNWNYGTVFSSLITKAAVTVCNDNNFDNKIALQILKMVMTSSDGKNKDNS